MGYCSEGSRNQTTSVWPLWQSFFNDPATTEIYTLSLHDALPIVADYCLYIEEAGMIAQLRDDTGGIRGLGKVNKIYLDNTNLIYALGREGVEIGNVRETFFFNQLRVNQDVITSSVSDFKIDGYTFEVGGRKKGQKQIEGIDNAFVVKDDIEYGHGNVIPLWTFGFNY